MWLVSREGKEERTVGQMVLFLLFSSCLAWLHSRMLCLHPTTHIPISDLCSLSPSLGWKKPEVVIHRRQSFCNLSFPSILLAFRMRDKEHGNFLFNTFLSTFDFRIVHLVSVNSAAILWLGFGVLNVWNTFWKRNFWSYSEVYY